MDNMNRLLSVKELAQEAGVSVYAIRQWLRSGQLPAVKISAASNSKYLIYMNDFKAVLDNRKHIPCVVVNPAANDTKPEIEKESEELEFGMMVNEMLKRRKSDDCIQVGNGFGD